MKQYEENKLKEFFSFQNLKEDIIKCDTMCQVVYDRVQEHQIKGSEISYYTFDKHIKNCQDINSDDPIKLLKCYNYKISKVNSRFASYYFNQRNNLIDRYNNL